MPYKSLQNDNCRTKPLGDWRRKVQTHTQRTKEQSEEKLYPACEGLNYLLLTTFPFCIWRTWLLRLNGTPTSTNNAWHREETLHSEFPHLQIPHSKLPEHFHPPTTVPYLKFQWRLVPLRGKHHNTPLGPVMIWHVWPRLTAVSSTLSSLGTEEWRRPKSSVSFKNSSGADEGDG